MGEGSSSTTPSIETKLCIDQEARAGLLSLMFKRVLKWFFGIVAVLLLVIAVLAVNAIWFRPWSLNRLLRKGFRGGDFRRTGVALLARPGRAIRDHRAQRESWATNRPPINRSRSDETRKNLAQLRAIRSRARRRRNGSRPHVLDWFLDAAGRGRELSVAQLPGEPALRGAEPVSRPSWRTPIGCSPRAIAIITSSGSMPCRRSSIRLLEGLKLREQKGIMPPRFVVEKVLKEMSDFVGAAGRRKTFSRASFKTARRENRGS